MLPRKDLSSSPERSRTCVTANLPCSRCRYDLQGQSIDSRCPECGLLVETSLHASIDLETIQGEGLPGPRRIAIATIALPLTASIWAIESTLIWGTMITSPLSTMTGPGSFTHLLLNLIAAMLAVGCIIAATVAQRAWRPFLDRLRFWTLYASCVVLAASPLLFVIAEQSSPSLSPSWWLLIAMIRTAALFALILATTHVLARIGRRGLAYRSAGMAIQSTSPLLIGLGVEFLTQAVLVMMPLDPMAPSGLASVLMMLGLASSVLVSLGMVYLFFNAIWGTLPLFRRLHRYSDLVASSDSPQDS
ncbi:MAG: hypothetical protein CBB69_006965 [Phycisphaera sp. TMED9]|nr:MAG: hypothetical protein CBB69_006965 [Phycisphaera sp. TMED9]